MRRRRAGQLGVATLVVLGVALTACTPEVTGGPISVAPIDVTVPGAMADASLPPGATYVSTIAVDSPPRAVDDLFVGTVFPGEERSDLAIVGFDAIGTQWSLSTNPSCAGWAATRTADGEGLVVALNSDARMEHGALAENTFASGFSSVTGIERWSAKPVIGPITANGALSIGAQQAILSNESTETQALTPSDGSALELPKAWSAARVVHEHFGVVLLAQGRRIAALDSGSGAILWSGPAPADFIPQASVGQALAFRSGDEIGQITVIHLSTGEVLVPATQGLEAVTSADGAQTILVAGAGSEQEVSLVSATGTMWSQYLPTEGSLRPVSVGADRVYLDASAARIVLAGADGTELSRGSFAVPAAVTTSGYGLIPTGNPGEYEMVHLGTN